MFGTILLCGVLTLISASAGAQSQSPYVGQQFREIKALSPQEISDYLSGKGMGLAKAAELNGYPGPAHVLELAAQLDLPDPLAPLPLGDAPGVGDRSMARATRASHPKVARGGGRVRSRAHA